MTTEADETPTQRLHRLTEYHPDREWDEPVDDPPVLQDFVPNDFERLAPLVKSYGDGLPRTALPRELPVAQVAALAVLGGSASTAGAAGVPGAAAIVDLAGLSRVLFLTAGVVRTRRREFDTVLFRAAGSAGGRFPLELYVAIPEGAGSDLPPGVHWYDPVEHALVRVAPAPSTTGGAPTVVVTGVPWRTGWRYAERGFRHVYWDAGTMPPSRRADPAPRSRSAGSPPVTEADHRHILH